MKGILRQQLNILDYSKFIRYTTYYWTSGKFIQAISIILIIKLQGALVGVTVLALFKLATLLSDLLLPYTQSITFKNSTLLMVCVELLSIIPVCMLWVGNDTLYIHTLMVLSIPTGLVSNILGVNYDDLLSKSIPDDKNITFKGIQIAERSFATLVGLAGASLAVFLYTDMLYVRIAITVSTVATMLFSIYMYNVHWNVDEPVVFEK